MIDRQTDKALRCLGSAALFAAWKELHQVAGRIGYTPQTGDNAKQFIIAALLRQVECLAAMPPDEWKEMSEGMPVA